MRALGAEIIRTRSSADFDEPDSHIRTAEALRLQLGPRAHILSQYTNAHNPLVHFDQTAEEVLRQCTEEGGSVKLDMFVAGAGTGGTITGVGRKLKSVVPECKVSVCV